MIRKIRINIEAKEDVQNAIDYYRLQQKGLGKKFESTLNIALKRIQKFPFASSFAFDMVRYKVMDTFPYIILYDFDDSNIYILRIFNTAQAPLF